MKRRRHIPADTPVLIVDDDELMAEFVERVLQTAGYKRLMTATSGEAAIDICSRQGMPTLLVTDLKMPRMNGDQLVAELRRRDPDLKVLYLTGFADTLFKNKERLWDGEAYLEKPCTISALLEAVSLLLTGEVSAEASDT
jgi:CheY-like chemotaxis protein